MGNGAVEEGLSAGGMDRRRRAVSTGKWSLGEGRAQVGVEGAGTLLLTLGRPGGATVAFVLWEVAGTRLGPQEHWESLKDDGW